MNEFDELLTELGVDEHELEQRKVEWRKQLQRSISQHRRVINHGIKKRGFDTDQNAIRRLSWHHQEEIMLDTIYEQKVNELLRPVQDRLALATSVHSVYHHFHFINAACSLILNRLGEKEEPTEVMLNVSINPNEDEALENQEVVYHALAKHLSNPADSEVSERVTLQTINSKLDWIINEIRTNQR